MYMPRFLVTQEVYDAASPSERQKYNYVVDERLLSLPQYFNIPDFECKIVNENENVDRPYDS